MNINTKKTNTKKLTIITKEEKKSFEVMLNPSQISYGVSLNYNTDTPPGNAETEAKWASTDPEKASFSITIDGTGVASQDEKRSVKQQIEELKAVTFKYDGEKHEPLPLTITWGEFIFDGRLQQLDIKYTLFDTEGHLLRAQVDLSFISSIKPEKSIKERKSNSPDLSHLRVVQKGDTLPLMCKRIYGDSQMYLEVARINGLINFRDLQPGTDILFPPIKK